MRVNRGGLASQVRRDSSDSLSVFLTGSGSLGEWHSVDNVRTMPSRSNNRMVLWIAIAAAVAIAAMVIAFVLPQLANGGHYTVTDNKVTIDTATIGPLGTVLVTDQGYALYTFPPDEHKNVTCYDRCALHWPPVFLAEGVSVVAGSGVDGSLLGSVTDRDGKRVATYKGWPLYLFQGDVAPGPATGQGQYLDGGYWYVIRANGEIVRPKPQQ